MTSSFAIYKVAIFTCLLAMLVGSTCLAPANAEDAMAQGGTLYLKGQYALARRCFEQVSMRQPNHWLAYYHLANCDVKLSDFNRAEQEYKRCIQLSNDPTVIKLCAAAIKNVVGHRSKDPTKKGASIASSPDNFASSDKSEQLAKLELEMKRNQLATKLVVQAGTDFQKRRDDSLARRDKIIADGKKHAQAARDRAQAEIQQLHENGNWICQNSATGAISVTVPTVVSDEIEARAEEEAARILRDAEHRAAGVFVPDYDNTAHHLLSGLTDKSKHGPKLNHHGTNMYVRSYTHSAPAHATKKDGAKLIAGNEAQGSSAK